MNTDELTVLDYFAAAEMHGVCASNYWTDHTYAEAAKNCYTLAEAMMAERERRQTKPTTDGGIG